MKSILLIFAFLFAANAGFAQNEKESIQLYNMPPQNYIAGQFLDSLRTTLSDLGTEGRVLVSLTISKDGVVKSIKLSSIQNKIFSDFILEVIQKTNGYWQIAQDKKTDVTDTEVVVPIRYCLMKDGKADFDTTIASSMKTLSDKEVMGKYQQLFNASPKANNLIVLDEVLIVTSYMNRNPKTRIKKVTT